MKWYTKKAKMMIYNTFRMYRCSYNFGLYLVAWKDSHLPYLMTDNTHGLITCTPNLDFLLKKIVNRFKLWVFGEDFFAWHSFPSSLTGHFSRVFWFLLNPNTYFTFKMLDVYWNLPELFLLRDSRLLLWGINKHSRDFNSVRGVTSIKFVHIFFYYSRS